MRLQSLTLLALTACNPCIEKRSYKEIHWEEFDVALEAFNEDLQPVLKDIPVYLDRKLDCDDRYMRARCNKSNPGCIVVCGTYESYFPENELVFWKTENFSHELVHKADYYLDLDLDPIKKDVSRWYKDVFWGTPQSNSAKKTLAFALYGIENFPEDRYVKDNAKERKRGKEELAYLCGSHLAGWIRFDENLLKKWSQEVPPSVSRHCEKILDPVLFE